jgi:hypothetical protein
MAGQSGEVTDCQAEPVSCQRERHELKPRYETGTKGWGADYVLYTIHAHTFTQRLRAPLVLCRAIVCAQHNAATHSLM